MQQEDLSIPEGMDERAVNVARAIRRKESNGNYNAVGDAGTSHGAYQWQPGTWKAHAAEAGVDANDFSPKNQDIVAYRVIKNRIDKGYGIPEIAAEWNSGDKNKWQNHAGTTVINGQTIQYDTPKYAHEVNDYYQQIKQMSGGGQSQASPVEKQKEELRAQGQPVSTQEDRSKPTFVGGILRGALKLPARIGASLLGLGEGALALGGSKDAAEGLDKLAREGIKSDYLGTVRPIGFTNDTGEGMNLKDTLGAGLEGASYLTGGGGVASVAKQGIKGLVKQGAIQGAKSGAVTGALGGTGMALQEGKTTGQSLFEGAAGGVAGGVLGGVLGGAGGAISKAKGFVGKGAQAVGLSKVDDEAVTKAEKEIAAEYERALPLTAKQKTKEKIRSDKFGENTFDTLAKQRIELKQNPDGTINPEVLDSIDEVSENFAKAADFAKKSENAYFNLDEVQKNAFKYIDDKIQSATARKAAKAKIQNEISDILSEGAPFEKNVNGENIVKSDIMERLRQIGNAWTPYNSADPERIGASTGYALADAVRDQVEKEGTFASYRALNKEWGKIIHAKKTMQDIVASGKRIKTMGGLSGEIARKVLTGGLGLHSGGITGLILAEMGGDLAARVLTDPSLRTSLERAVIRNSESKLPKNEIIQKVLQEVEEAIQKQADLPRLPAPRYIEGQPYKGSQPTPIQVTSGLLPLGEGRVPIEEAPPLQLPAKSSYVEQVMTLPKSAREVNLGTNETKNATIRNPADRRKLIQKGSKTRGFIK